MVSSPDLNDPDIRALLDRNHVPEEQVIRVGAELTTFEVICEQCRLPYPCTTRKALREHSQKRRETALKAHWNSYPKQTCNRSEPHGEHSYTQWAQTYYCSGTSYDIVDCDASINEQPHKAHVWNFRGANFWCPGG